MSNSLIATHFTSFNSDISQCALPDKFTYPFCYEVHPLALAASEELQLKLASFHPLNSEQKGRMYGVLVVKNKAGKVGYLSALSGNATEDENQNSAAINFVPTLYKAYNQSEFEQVQQVEINAINAKITQLSASPELANLTTLLATNETEGETEIQALQQQMRDNKKSRKDKREWLTAQINTANISEEEQRDISIALSRASVTDKKSLQKLKQHHQSKITATSEQLLQLTDEIALLKKTRKKQSSKLQKHFFKQYKLLNSTGEIKDLIEIFKGTILQKPPAGSGDCAAPKLLQYAFEQNLTPVCMAEFWWGKQPSSEIRKHKYFYPSCQSKCLPILTHMLNGMSVDDNPLLVNPAENIDLEIIFQDEHVVVVNKPAGLLSVPGKSIKDSVYTRIKTLIPEATGGLIVHRLDMATSGLLMLSLNENAQKSLQQQFVNKEVSKRYVAAIDGKLGDGNLTEKTGEIRLPLRGDFDDRPKQMVCHEFGKYAETRWQIIENTNNDNNNTTKLYLYPITGRTHQLRMHCAHPDGLNIPIVGDNLYGNAADRLHLHAQRLSFRHPVTKEQLTFEVDETF